MKFTGIRGTVAGAVMALWSLVAPAQESVHFPSLDPTVPSLDGYLFRPAGEGRHPAVVGLHGCSGMFSKTSGRILPIYRAWAAELTGRGHVFLLVDSFGP